MKRETLERTAAIVVVMLLAACASTSTPMSWSATATERPGFRGAGANANAASSGNSTSVSVAFREAVGMTGTERPWHVHYGRCGDDQGIVGDANIYTPLRPRSDGTAMTTATIPMRLTPDRSYFINIHKSASELSTIVACGEFTSSMTSGSAPYNAASPSNQPTSSTHASHH